MAALAPEHERSDNSITALPVQLSAGNREVEAQLTAQVYGELRRLASRCTRAESGNRTRQPTALVLVLHQSLEYFFAQFGPHRVRIVDLHFFGGLNFQEIAVVLDASGRTVKREWSMARAWLQGELSRQP